MTGLGTGLRQLSDALDGSVDAIYRRSGLDFRARFFPYFRLLNEHGDLAVGELAAMLGFTQPAVTQTLARMRDEGLIARVSSQDRRERRYRLTGKAGAMLPALRRIWDAAERASARLDEALPAPISVTVHGALRQLSHTTFSQMIEEELSFAENDTGSNTAGANSHRIRPAEAAGRPE